MVRTLVVFVRPEVNPREVPPLRLSESSVQDGTADSLAPSLGNDEEKVKEAAAGYERTRPVVAAQRFGGRHPDERPSLGRHEEPRGRIAQVRPDMFNPGRSVRPNTLTAGEIRPLVDGGCRIDVSGAT
jgi:hypothetical protein